MPGASFHGTNALVQRRQVHPPDKLPHRSHRVILRNQVVECAGVQLELVTVRASETQGCSTRRRLRTEGGLPAPVGALHQTAGSSSFPTIYNLLSSPAILLAYQPASYNILWFLPARSTYLQSVHATHHGKSASGHILDFFTTSQGCVVEGQHIQLALEPQLLDACAADACLRYFVSTAPPVRRGVRSRYPRTCSSPLRLHQTCPACSAAPERSRARPGPWFHCGSFARIPQTGQSPTWTLY